MQNDSINQYLDTLLMIANQSTKRKNFNKHNKKHFIIYQTTTTFFQVQKYDYTNQSCILKKYFLLLKCFA